MFENEPMLRAEVVKLAAQIREYEATIESVRELAKTWTSQQSEYPPEGLLAAVTVRLCVEELLAALGEGHDD